MMVVVMGVSTCDGCICRVWVLVRRMHPPPTFCGHTQNMSLGLRVDAARWCIRHTNTLRQHEHPSRVLDAFIRHPVVMDASNIWRAAGDVTV